MKNYLLGDYSLSVPKLIKSLVVSELCFRHWEQAKLQPEYKWGHRVIAAIEYLPLLGHIASLIEILVARCICKDFPAYFPNRVWLFRGSQQEAIGDVSVGEVEAVRTRLENLRSPGIRFNRNTVRNHIEGGACTAMSLDMIDRYFEIKNACVGMPNNNSEMLLGRISEIGTQFASTSAIMRIRQAAYNTIEVEHPHAAVDHSRNKIQAMASDHGLLVNYASPEIDTTAISSESALASDVDALPEGTYIVRILQPANNERLEVQGHSLVYIKEAGVNMYYDPNHGARNLVGIKHSAVLFQSFKDCFSQFQISKARFYRVQQSP